MARTTRTPQMPQQTKTEALEELARLIRRDIMNGTARLNETWWFDDDTRMQDRIAHVLLDYSDEDPGRKPLDVVSMAQVLDGCGVQKPGPYDNATLRIDTDMSDPQPGKLLVVRLDADDVGRGWVDVGELTENGRGKDTQNFWPSQRVGFLVGGDQ